MSLGSASHRLPDWTEILRDVETWAERLIRAESSVVGVLAFGALARRSVGRTSRAELIVVVEASPHPPWRRAQHLPALHLPLRHEIIVYTRPEFQGLREAGNHFVRRALAEGRWLARGGGPPVRAGEGATRQGRCTR